MRIFVAAALAAMAVSAAGHAQASRDAYYDGSNIPGWTYSPEGAELAGLPTWYAPSSDVDGANCNIGVSELRGGRQEFLDYFNSVTPASFAAQLQANGLNIIGAHLTEVIELDGRPAMRNIVTATSGEDNFELMMVSISGAYTLLTVTCTVRQGGFLGRMQSFYQFVDGLDVQTTAPQ